MKPGDYIIKPNGADKAAIWRVTGVYYGVSGHQNVVGLIPINRKLPAARCGDVKEMLAPLELVEPYLAQIQRGEQP